MMGIEQIMARGESIQEKARTLLVSRSVDRPTSLQIVVWVGMVLIAIAASLSNFLINQVGSRFDEDRYLILSRSLVFADRYGMIHSPGEPLPERYPFGYPLLISPIVWLFPEQLDAPKVLSLAATVLNITLLFWGWRWFCQGRSYWWGLAIAGLYALSPITIDFSRRIMSEAIFTTFSLIAILVAEKRVRERSNRWFIPALSGALAFVVFTRTIGIVLLACIFVYLLYMKRMEGWFDILKILLLMSLLVGLIVVVTPVQLRNLIPMEYFNHDKNARPLVTLLTGNPPSSGDLESSPQPASTGWSQKVRAMRDLLGFGLEQHLGIDIRAITIPFGFGVLEQVLDRSIGNSSLILRIISYIVSGLVVFGLIRLISREQFSLFNFYAVLYFGALFLWQWTNPRLLLPIQPQIQLAWLIALETMILWGLTTIKGRSFSVRSTPLVLSMITILFLFASAYDSFHAQDSRMNTGDLSVRSEWLKMYTQDSDIIMTERPEVDYLYSGRKTVSYPNKFSSPEELEVYLVENEIDYILVAPSLGWFTRYSPQYSEMTEELLPLVADLEAEDRVQLIYSQDDDLIRVYQIPQGS